LLWQEKQELKEQDPYKNYKVIDDLPFNSEQKFRASLVDTGEGKEIFVIGAPETYSGTQYTLA
jgi:P-type Ca2+ transporter type 2C